MMDLMRHLLQVLERHHAQGIESSISLTSSFIYWCISYIGYFIYIRCKG